MKTFPLSATLLSAALLLIPSVSFAGPGCGGCPQVKTCPSAAAAQVTMSGCGTTPSLTVGPEGQ